QEIIIHLHQLFDINGSSFCVLSLAFGNDDRYHYHSPALGTARSCETFGAIGSLHRKQLQMDFLSWSYMQVNARLSFISVQFNAKALRQVHLPFKRGI
ncbi:unnamed protein product, partial [Musa acuminata subsp. burmannicoides]